MSGRWLHRVIPAGLLLGAFLAARNAAGTIFPKTAEHACTGADPCTLYVDTASAGVKLNAGYVAYRITGILATEDVSVTIGSFAGGVITKDPDQPSTLVFPANTHGTTITAFFFVDAIPGGPASGQTHTVTVTGGTSGSQGPVTFTYDVEEAAASAANKIDVVLYPAVLPSSGQPYMFSVDGHTGTIGAQNLLQFTPASSAANAVGWLPSVLKLQGTKMCFDTLSPGSCAGALHTYVDGGKKGVRNACLARIEGVLLRARL